MSKGRGNENISAGMIKYGLPLCNFVFAKIISVTGSKTVEEF